MTDDNSDQAPVGEDNSGGGRSQTGAGDQDPFSELQDKLTELQNEKSGFEALTLDANIADLQKLIADAKKAKDEYDKAHPDLAAEETRLADFKKNTQPDLEAMLQQAGLDAVSKAVKDAVKEVDDAEYAVETLKGRIPDGDESTSDDTWKRGEVGVAAKALAKAEKDFTKAETVLNNLRALAKAVADRQKKMQAAEKEILKLGRTGQPATAYWLLTQTALNDKRGHELLSGTDFFSGMTDPAVIPPAQLESDIWKAWQTFAAARKAKTEAAADLRKKQDDLKEAEKTLADLKKNLRKTIADALAEWETDRVNPAA